MRIAAHIIVAVAQAISLVQASNLFSDVHHESYNLMKGQSQVAHDEMKLRGGTVEKKTMRASKAKQHQSEQQIDSKARQKNCTQLRRAPNVRQHMEYYNYYKEIDSKSNIYFT